MALELSYTGEAGYSVTASGRKIGSILLYDNAFHAGCRYVKLHFDNYDPHISGELFDRLSMIAGKPLQATICSADAGLAEFLKAGGFILKRRCYEAEVRAADRLRVSADTGMLQKCRAGDMDYAECCRLLHTHYTLTHAGVSPLTAGFEEFCRNIPETALYEKRGGRIAHAAFIEENEIAYVCGMDGGFEGFALRVTDSLFAEYETIEFESDDCDGCAMLLRGLFATGDGPSYDTYIKQLPG